MDRKEVESSQIMSVGYERESLGKESILEIEFKGKNEQPGSVYQYFDVPPQVHQDLMAAESIGRYFGQRIRGKFQFKKLEPEKAEARAS